MVPSAGFSLTFILHLSESENGSESSASFSPLIISVPSCLACSYFFFLDFKALGVNKLENIRGSFCLFNQKHE